MSTWFTRVRHFLQRRRLDADLREEIENHRAMRQSALEADGLTPEAAAAASRRALGNVNLAIEDARDVWVIRAVDSAWQDLRAAARALRKSRAFTIVAIGTLALGIGANTALFSIYNSLMFRPLPVRDPGSLVLLDKGSWTYPIWDEIQRLGGGVFAGTLAWTPERFDLSNGGETRLVDGALVSGRYFDVLGVTASLGRVLSVRDDVRGTGDMVVVISHRFWQEQFGGSHDVIGRSVTVQRVPFTVVGVLPPQFFGTDVGRRNDLFIPLALHPVVQRNEGLFDSRSTWWLEFMMRLEPGQTIEQANVGLRTAQEQIRAATMPENYPEVMRAQYLEEPLTLVSAATGRSGLRRQFATPLGVLVGAVGLVLLVACANIASLLLARAVSRRRELSVRLALGASRWRVARLLLVESALIAGVGAVLGLAVARWGSSMLVTQLATWRGAVSLGLETDWRVLAFTGGLACMAALVSGVAPVFGITGVLPNDALKDGGRGVAGDRRFAVRGVLVVAQVALSLLLVVTAGLFLRSFTALSQVPLGFDPESRVLVEVQLHQSAVPAGERGALIGRLRDAARDTPGVAAAAASIMTPVSGGGWNSAVGLSPASPGDRSAMTWINAVTPGWFNTMGIRMLGGRDLVDGDLRSVLEVAIVNQTFAARFLAPGSPIGQAVYLGRGDDAKRYEIVGLVADAVYGQPREGRVATIYLPMGQQTPGTIALTVATLPGQRAAVERALVGALVQTDPDVAITFRTYHQLLDATVTQERLVALLASFFGALALLLAGIGVYGIVAHAVRARQVELGVRIALGATPRRIVGLVVRGVSLLVAGGLFLGLLAALWAAQFVEALLFELEPRDPATFIGAAATLLVVGLLAAWLPARRAARLDPARVLREG